MSITISLRTYLLSLSLLAGWFMPFTASGMTCSLSQVGAINFGGYDVLSRLPDRSVGFIHIRCDQRLILRDVVTISLSEGNSGNYLSRYLNQGKERLYYNLYIDPSDRHIFGDGSDGSDVITLHRVDNVTVPIYSKIPPQQLVAAGHYADHIQLTINF